MPTLPGRVTPGYTSACFSFPACWTAIGRRACQAAVRLQHHLAQDWCTVGAHAWWPCRSFWLLEGLPHPWGPGTQLRDESFSRGAHSTTWEGLGSYSFVQWQSLSWAAPCLAWCWKEAPQSGQEEVFLGQLTGVLSHGRDRQSTSHPGVLRSWRDENGREMGNPGAPL